MSRFEDRSSSVEVKESERLQPSRASEPHIKRAKLEKKFQQQQKRMLAEVRNIGGLRRKLALMGLQRPVEISNEPILNEDRIIKVAGQDVKVYYLSKEELNKQRLGAAFGFAHQDILSPFVYVRQDLPERVKKFVLHHELYHIRDTRHDHWILREIRANLIPGLKDPLGLLATIVMTLGSKDRLRFYWQRFRANW